MLVLARKKGESLIIGDQIEVVILGIEGDTIRIGIEAPRSVQVYRKEVYEQIGQQNREASSNPINPASLGKLLRKKD